MNHVEAMERLFELYNQIRPVLEKNLPFPAIAYRREKIEKSTAERIQHTIKWLEAFIEVRIAKILEVEEHVPQSMWDSYRQMGLIEGGQTAPWEVNQRADAVRKMRQDWKTRPQLLRKEGAIFDKTQVGPKRTKKKKS